MLTDTKIKQAKVTDKPYKIYDSEGLYIEVAPIKEVEMALSVERKGKASEFWNIPRSPPEAGP